MQPYFLPLRDILLPMMSRLLALCLCLITGSVFAQPDVSKRMNLLANWDQTGIPNNNANVRFNEVWGFVQDGREYGVIGSTIGAHIIEITPDNQALLSAYVPGTNLGVNVVHRDYHDYQGYLYAVSDQGPSTLQIIDLQFLPDSAPVVYSSDTLINTAHNVFIDEATAKLYACGPNGHAMSIYSIADPVNPILLRHFDAVNYVHDAFVRNDTAWLNCANEGLYIYDFSNNDSKLLGSLDFYPDQGYNHSGWLSPDGKTYVFADETAGMRMKVCDVSDLSDIRVVSLFNSGFSDNTVPHNLMLKGDFVYVSHYNDGVQVFNIKDPKNPQQVGWYDSYLIEGGSIFKGVWGIYAFLPSGKILGSDRVSGLYVLGFNPPPDINTNLDHAVFPNPLTDESYLNFTNRAELDFELEVYDSRGKLVQTYGPTNDTFIRLNRGSLNRGTYYYHLIGTNNDIRRSGKFMVVD